MTIAAFDEFTALLAGDEVTVGFDRVVFDTAQRATPCGCSRATMRA